MEPFINISITYYIPLISLAVFVLILINERWVTITDKYKTVFCIVLAIICVFYLGLFLVFPPTSSELVLIGVFLFRLAYLLWKKLEDKRIAGTVNRNDRVLQLVTEAIMVVGLAFVFCFIQGTIVSILELRG